MSEDEKNSALNAMRHAADVEVRRVELMKDEDLPTTPSAVRAKIIGEMRGLERNMETAVLYYEPADVSPAPPLADHRV